MCEYYPIAVQELSGCCVQGLSYWCAGVQGLSYCVWGLSHWPIGVWGDDPVGAVCEGCSRLVPCLVRPSHCTWNVRRARGAYPLCVCIQGVTSLSFRTQATAPCIMLVVVVLVGGAGIDFFTRRFVVPKALTTNGRFCLLYTSPSPRDLSTSRMPSSA